jgi:hypothetical protein
VRSPAGRTLPGRPNAIQRLVDQLSETVDLLQAAGPDVLADVYDELGLQVLYTPGSKTIRVRIPADGNISDEHWPQPSPSPHRGVGEPECRRGDLCIRHTTIDRHAGRPKVRLTREPSSSRV